MSLIPTFFHLSRRHTWFWGDIVFTLMGAYLGYHGFKKYDTIIVITGTGLFSVLGYLCGKVIMVCFIGVGIALAMGLSGSSKN